MCQGGIPVALFLLFLVDAPGAGGNHHMADEVQQSGLSFIVSLNKKEYLPTDAIVLSFSLKNESGKEMFLSDGYLAPDYNEAGPGRHFELEVVPDGKPLLYFWSGKLTEGRTSSIRKVFKLMPGDAYSGTITLRLRVVQNKNQPLDPNLDSGKFEDSATGKNHVLGKDGQKYSVVLRYQVKTKSFVIWKSPGDFRNDLLWVDSIESRPIEFAVSSN